MHNVTLSSEDKFFIEESPVEGNIRFEAGKLTYLKGENGVGKSTFIHFLKLNQDKLFPKYKCNFLDQMRLTPVNEISFDQVINNFQKLRNEKLEFYDTYFHSVKDYSGKPIGSLSGGQNQMIKIMLSAYLGGDIFFFDEPLQFLDKKNRAFFKEFILYLKKNKKTIFLIEHSEPEIKELVNYTFRIEKDNDRILIGDELGN